LLFEAASNLITRRYDGIPGLKRWALKLKAKIARKKATVALAIMMHWMWIDGTEYRPA